MAAGPGDEVCAIGAQILVNRVRVAGRREVDAAGRDLPQRSGCSMLTDQVFLLGDNPASFDGRYFGPVPHANIIGRARLLWPL